MAKVDDVVAAAADQADPSTPLDVIVYGNDLQGANNDAKLHAKKSLAVIGGESATIAAGDIDAVAAEPGVSYISPDNEVASLGRLKGGPSFSALATLFPQVDGAPAAWARGYTGKGVGIAVIDSGIAPSGDFGKRVKVKIGNDGGNDAFGHGTAVADIAAGNGDKGTGYVGIAPDATLVSIDVETADGVNTSDVIAGLGWVLQNAGRYDIRVVNLSLTETTPTSYLASPLDTVVEQLWQAGVVVVAAAGNEGPGQEIYAPGNDPFAIAVGAADSNDTPAAEDDLLAPWSSTGPTGDGFQKPDLVAPGRHVGALLPTTSVLGQLAPTANWLDRGYASVSGTSFAAPQVAGAAAILLQQHPDWTPDQVKWVLTQTARPLAGSDAGALDLDAATSFSGTPGSANQGLSRASFGAIGASPADMKKKGNKNVVLTGSGDGTATNHGWVNHGWVNHGWVNHGWVNHGWVNHGWTGFNP